MKINEFRGHNNEITKLRWVNIFIEGNVGSEKVHGQFVSLSEDRSIKLWDTRVELGRLLRSESCGQRAQSIGLSFHESRRSTSLQDSYVGEEASRRANKAWGIRAAGTRPAGPRNHDKARLTVTTPAPSLRARAGADGDDEYRRVVTGLLNWLYKLDSSPYVVSHSGHKRTTH